MRRKTAYEEQQARHEARSAQPNYGRVVPAIEQERLDQMFCTLKLRRQGLTYKAIGQQVLSTLANRHGRLKKPHVRSVESVRRLFEEARHHEAILAEWKGEEDPATHAYLYALGIEATSEDARDAWLVAADAQEERSWWTYSAIVSQKTPGFEDWLRRLGLGVSIS